LPYLDEKRRGDRVPLDCAVDVKDGRSLPGGVVRDVSKKGVAVQYASDNGAVECPLEIGETVPLAMAGRSVGEGRVTRKFDGGFAVELDDEIDIKNIID